MAFPRIGGPGIPLSNSAGLVPFPSSAPTVASGLTNVITLLPANIFNIPAGTFMCAPGPYTSLQWNDPVTGQWRTINGAASIAPRVLDSDGGNYRLANLTGTPIGAFITNAGSGYTNGIGTAATGLTITPSAGGSTWVPVVGGSNGTAPTITAAGSGYLFAPIIIIDAPPLGGIQATATCTISGAAVNAVTMTNPGAGYTGVPAFTVVNDPRDTAGSGCVLTGAALTGSGILTCMYPSNPGTVLTAVPTFTWAPASTTAATCIMNFTVTGLTVTGGGTAVPAGSSLIGFFNSIVTGTRAANTAGPIADALLTQPRPALISPSIAGGVIQGTNNTIVDAGFGLQAVPTMGLVSSTGVAPTAGTNITALVGGTTDTSYLQRI
jgi:hypothetical protein